MSGRSPVVFSADAQADLVLILLESAERWGDDQSKRYEAKLQASIASLGNFPEMGARRDELRPGLRILPVEQHVIMYELVRGRVEILRILHKRANPRSRLGDQ